MFPYLCILIAFASSLSFAQNFQFELKGSYQLATSVKSPVEFSLQWSERKDGKIEGSYRDNFFIDKASVQGNISSSGRTFIVDFPGIKKGVHSLVILSSVAKNDQTGTQIPVSVITRDQEGNPLTTVKTSSQFFQRSSPQIAQRQEEGCTEGFGVLAGFCGIYSGMISEEMDRKNKCNLLFAEAARLELKPDSTVVLHLGQPNSIVENASHSIGRIPVNPQKDAIDIMGRVCSNLVGVNSTSDVCKILHLSGRFTTEGENKHFRGTYTINEEGKNTTCRYGISMDKQFAP